MPRKEISLIYGPIGEHRDSLGIVLNRSPEVGEIAIEIVYCLNAWGRGPRKKDRERTGERLDVV
jgi:hypothetical protein